MKGRILFLTSILFLVALRSFGLCRNIDLTMGNLSECFPNTTTPRSESNSKITNLRPGSDQQMTTLRPESDSTIPTSTPELAPKITTSESGPDPKITNLRAESDQQITTSRSVSDTTASTSTHKSGLKITTSGSESDSTIPKTMLTSAPKITTTKPLSDPKIATSMLEPDSQKITNSKPELDQKMTTSKPETDPNVTKASYKKLATKLKLNEPCSWKAESLRLDLTQALHNSDLEAVQNLEEQIVQNNEPLCNTLKLTVCSEELGKCVCGEPDALLLFSGSENPQKYVVENGKCRWSEGAACLNEEQLQIESDLKRQTDRTCKKGTMCRTKRFPCSFDWIRLELSSYGFNSKNPWDILKHMYRGNVCTCQVRDW